MMDLEISLLLVGAKHELRRQGNAEGAPERATESIARLPARLSPQGLADELIISETTECAII